MFKTFIFKYFDQNKKSPKHDLNHVPSWGNGELPFYLTEERRGVEKVWALYLIFKLPSM